MNTLAINRLGLCRRLISPCRLLPSTRSFASQPPSVYRPPQSSNEYRRFKSYTPFYKSKRMWVFTVTGTVMFGGYYVAHLEKVPISGRWRFVDVSPRLEEAMAKQAYNEVMHTYGHRILPHNHPYTAFVARVGRRLVQVSGMKDMQWEFHVINSPERNAFVLPGGKVFVFTGILPIVQNDDGMAAVLGHEISHQLARHSAEKLSFAKLLYVIRIRLLLLGIDTSVFFNRFTTEFLMMMPFSRKCETEADAIGLQLMAQACFDPNEAINVWRRMESAGGASVPQFASTHPSHKNRIQYLQKELPSALAKQAESDCSSELRSYADMFHKTWASW